ncbi:MAG: glycosyl hydrolase family 43, partial [Muribaculaceae bacterium]|nr:glycosyl hydrolase family 43 [Muribaculaceae bacterium]
VLIFSRMSAPGEWGLEAVNYTLAYAYSDNPLGPWVYGGTIIDARGRGTDSEGKTIPTTTPYGNTHGSILEIDGQWYVFYHRQTGLDEYARQAMVSPIEVSVEEGPGGKVVISEAELTSEGFEINGLDPRKRYSAAIASVTMGPEPVVHEYPNNIYSGPYFETPYLQGVSIRKPYDESVNYGTVVNCTDGSTVGWKYFNFDLAEQGKKPTLELGLVPLGVDGKIDVYTEAPWKGKAKPVGSYELKASLPQESTVVSIPLRKSLSGRLPVYLVFSSPTHGRSMATLETIAFR